MTDHGSFWDQPTPRRHPCEVTADRLLDHLDRFPDEFDGKARDDISHVRHLLQQIAEKET